MKTLSRRATLSAPLVLMTPAFQAADQSYGGFAIDLNLAPQTTRDATLRSLRAQIDLVNSLKIKPDVMAWFRTVPLIIDPSIREPGEFRNGRLALKDIATPADNPLLLHELLHGWHFQMMPGRRRNPEVLAFYAQAKASGAFPAQSYMMSNVGEFFAMTASVVLWGKAARPPSTRERLRAVMPAYYDWLVGQFGLQL